MSRENEKVLILFPSVLYDGFQIQLTLQIIQRVQMQ